jgi:putative oxidoreductase
VCEHHDFLSCADRIEAFYAGLRDTFEPGKPLGFPHLHFTAHFVGTFEVACAFLLLIGLWTKAAAVPLLIVIAMSIVTTKNPELFRANQGVWYMVSDARTGLAMLCSLLFLISVGGGAWSLDARRKLKHFRRTD